MHILDYAVLAVYFVLMAAIGVWSARRVKAQEDYFLGGRGFGKVLQTFAAFGAGTGSSDPVNTARTTFTGGLSGMWSVMYWLFVTPFYWFTAVWYRRMRHLTLGDWFVERYESRWLGAAYACFGILFYMVYGSMLFSAIGKVAAPLIGTGSVELAGRQVGLEYVLVPLVGVVVLIYGTLGGLRAAYWTDLIQGLCIILLSVLLIPFGLNALVERFGDPGAGMADGFRILHERVPPQYFSVVGSTTASEFPLHRIVAVVLINLVGIVVQPHFIATGGGSAKTEMTARVGLVTGNFLKRLCTVGWAFTALLAIALLADRPELASDPDRTWGVLSRELLGPGLTGLMLACLLAALMSSVDAYMIVGSGLVVRNIYAPFVDSTASERAYVNLARATGVIVVGGGVVISLFYMDVFEQLQLTWIVPVLFAAPFWLGILWRRATTRAAWVTVAWCAAVFFIIPWLAPYVRPALRTSRALAVTNDLIITSVERRAAPADVARREAAIRLWDQRHGGPENQPDAAAAPRPEPLAVGQMMTETTTTGGKSVFWSKKIVPVDDEGVPRADVVPLAIGPPRTRADGATVVVKRYPDDVRLEGQGNLQLDYLLYAWAGMDLSRRSNAALATLSLPPKIVTPFLVMIFVSLLTRPGTPAALDRYYAKMRTPVAADPEEDRQRLEASQRDPSASEDRKLWPGSQVEILRPSLVDVSGFVLSVAACFGIVGLAVWVARIGS